MFLNRYLNKVNQDLLVFFIIFFSSLIVFKGSLFSFFAQDDFLLISYFSGSDLINNLIRALGRPEITHWRPTHNLFFLVTGTLFGKNFLLYHLLVLVMHTAIGFLIYRILLKLKLSFFTALTSSLIYATASSHFTSLYWISGSATSIGLFFYLLFFYAYQLKSKILPYIFLALSLLASEASFVGMAIFFTYIWFFEREKIKNTVGIFLTSIVILAARIYFFSLLPTPSDYQLGLSINTLMALKYYLLRISNFPDVSKQIVILVLNSSFLLVITLSFIHSLIRKKDLRYLFFSILILFFGLFPFILIPDHLSAHYMNFSIFGFAMLSGLMLSKNRIMMIICLVFFISSSILSVNQIVKNSWVTKKASIAKGYLMLIERENLPDNSKIVFLDDKLFFHIEKGGSSFVKHNLSSSLDAYISLGTGKGLDFWFKDKGYRYCFSWFENCSTSFESIDFSKDPT